LRERHHLIPGSWHDVTSSVKCLLGIKDEGLAIGTSPNASHNFTIRAGHHSKFLPGFAIVLFNPIGINQFVHIDGITLFYGILKQAGLGVVHDIGSVSTIQANVNVRFKLLGAGILNINTGFVFKGFDGIIEHYLVLIGERTSHGYYSPFIHPSVGIC